MPYLACLAIVQQLAAGAPNAEEAALSPSAQMLRGYYEQMCRPKPFLVRRGRQFEMHQAELRKKVLECAGLRPLPERIRLDVRKSKPLDHPWCVVRRVYFQLWPGVYSSGLLYWPKQFRERPAPAVLNPHGHWQNGNAHPDVQKRCLNFARMGYVTLSTTQNHYEDLYVGVSHQTLMIWTNMRALDYLETLPEVDKTRIGAAGASGGGLQTQMIAALDPRIKAAAIVGMTCDFRQIMFPDRLHCGCNHFPNIMRFTDHPEISALALPTPVQYLTMNDWTKDFEKDNFPTVRALYAAAGLPDRAHCKYFDTPHTYDKPKREQTYWWMQKWLRGEDQMPPEPDDTKTFPPETLVNLKAEVPEDKGFEQISSIYRRQWGYHAPALSSPAQWRKYQQKMVNELRGLLGEDARRHGSAVESARGSANVEEELAIERVGFPSEDGILVPTIIVRLRAANGRLPVVLMLGGGGKEALLKETGPEAATRLAREGSLVVLPDVRCFGELFSTGGKNEELQKSTWQRNGVVWGRPVLGMACTDLQAVLDGLSSRPDADAKRIGVIARGSGDLAMAALFAAALDGRIASADVDLDNCCFEKRNLSLVPRILQHGDVLEWAALLADRRLTIRNVPPEAGDLGWLSGAFSANGNARNLRIQQAKSSAKEGQGPPAWQASAKSPPAIICAEAPSAPMALAARELTRCLEKILGVTLPEATKDGRGPAIRLSINKDADLTDEGYELRAEGSVYHITGGGQLGLVFGAYEFLRRFGGCRFSDLGPDGEYVPRKDRIEAEAGPLRRKPKLWYRGLQFYFGENAELCRQRIDWMAKNGFNYVTYTPAPEDADPETLVRTDPQTGNVVAPADRAARFSKEWFDRELRGAIRERGMKLDMNHHNLLYWLPPSRCLAEHPEWYAEADGKRGQNLSQLCICTSNQEAVNTLIRNVRKYLRENPEVKIVGVIPEDGIGMCQCKKCVAADPDPQEAFRRPNSRVENQSKSSRYHRLLNQVAAAVRDEFPDVLVGGAAYVDLLWPARDVTLQPNTTVWVALYWRDGCRPMTPGRTSDRNQHFLDILQNWKKVFPGRLIVYEYYMGMSAQRALPYPISGVICEDWTHLKKLGVEGATIQCWTENHSVYTLNNLAFAACAWRDHVDHKQVLDDFLLGAYGSAAEQIRPIYEGLIRAVRDQARGQSDLLPNADNIRYFLNEAGRDTIRSALAVGRQKAAGDRERRQVEKLAAAVGYWEMAAEVFELREQASRLRKTDPNAALTLLDKAVDHSIPKLQQYIKTSMPPGWLDVRTPSRWDSTAEEMSRAAAEIRSTASGAAKTPEF